MTANVTSINAVPDSTYGSSAPAGSSGGGAPAPAVVPGQANQPTSADLRLVIEDDQKAGCFVYKTVDWRTGEVVQQIPREELVKLREATDYAAGSVISTKA
jgi:flagellar protein FlaG